MPTRTSRASDAELRRDQYGQGASGDWKMRMASRTVSICVAWSLLFLGGALADGAEPDWKAGLAQVKITPSVPVALAGYAARTKPFEKVAADLYVKAMVLEDAAGGRGVLVTSDLIGFPADVAEPICQRLQEKTGLRREQILLNSSHTHAGPLLNL